MASVHERTRTYTEDEIREMYVDNGGEECAEYDEYVSTFFEEVDDGLYIESESSRNFKAWLFGEVYSGLTIYR